MMASSSNVASMLNLFRFFMIVALWLACPAVVQGQVTPEPKKGERPFAQMAETWTRTLDRVAQ